MDINNFKIGQVLTDDGSFTLKHPDYDEEFHSRAGARRETFELYMLASGYQARLQAPERDEIGILDIGLGLGYNALMTIDLWIQGPGTAGLSLLSLEHTEDLIDALISADTAWKDGWSGEWKTWSQALRKSNINPSLNLWTASFTHPLTAQILCWRVLLGDARDADFHGQTFDFVWQDAFSHKKNPELWTPTWFAKVLAASKDKVSLVTYSVARSVRDNLELAGWSQERFAAGGTKKQWLRARKA
jgi:tRNA U34 5-methylaminomethyl-2-thiouridine-forming methyltransferase MnmC